MGPKNPPDPPDLPPDDEDMPKHGSTLAFRCRWCGRTLQRIRGVRFCAKCDVPDPTSPR